MLSSSGFQRPLAFFLLAVLLFSVGSRAEEDPGKVDDPWRAYHWLEALEGSKALAWVEEQNQKARSHLIGLEMLEPLKAHAAEVGEQDRWLTLVRSPPAAEQTGPFAQRVSGSLWARMPLDDYLQGLPPSGFRQDINQLLRTEPGSHVFEKVDCLAPDFQRCLVFYRLSGDRNLSFLREFDASEQAWVDPGFRVHRARTWATYRDRDSVYIATNLTDPATFTNKLRLWRRGEALEDARVIYEASEFDVRLKLLRRGDRVFLAKELKAFDVEYFQLSGKELRPLALPRDLEALHIVGDQLLVHLRSAWEQRGRRFSSGSVIAAPLASVDRGEATFRLVKASSRDRVVDEVWGTKDLVIVRILEDVQSTIEEWTLDDGRWTGRILSMPRGARIEVESTLNSLDRYHLFQEDFFSASTWLRDETGTVTRIQKWSGPFDPEDYTVEQRFAESADGTRVPYFLVGRDAVSHRGPRPVLMTGYGGWGTSQLPFRLTKYHRWLQDGGLFVLANIRGGGEYGPEWHYAARREKRQTAYDDFLAVAADLVLRKVTVPGKIGIFGASNGGALVANAFIQRPELFGAVRIGVGSLDWQRCSSLSGGVPSGERGDARLPEEWAFMRGLSPLHNLAPDRPYPPILLMANRGDDVSHPCHSRKFVHRMNDLGYDDVYYLEAATGGHGHGIEDRDELTLAFFYDRLSKEGDAEP